MMIQEKNAKRPYATPSMREVELRRRANLLSASDGPDQESMKVIIVG